MTGQVLLCVFVVSLTCTGCSLPGDVMNVQVSDTTEAEQVFAAG
jgi:hypothetical protein